MNPEKTKCYEVDSCVIKCLMVRLPITQVVMHKTKFEKFKQIQCN